MKPIVSILLVISGCLLFHHISPAQNLIPNCDFSLFSGCPDDHSQFDKARPWFTPGDGTSDFCHACSGNKVSIPVNMWGEQDAFSGEGYGHVISYYPFQGNDYREYMAVELACELPAGEEFMVSFYVSCSDRSRYAIDGMGLHFSDSPLLQNGSGAIDVGGIPHISNQLGNVLMNKTGWTLISGLYVASGGEKYITIGNFLRDDQTTIHNFSGQTTRYSSYYIDQVSVVPVREWLNLGNDTTVCSQDILTLSLSLPCQGEILWSTGSKEPFIQVDEPGSYSVTVELGCGSISDQINVYHTPVPVIPIPGDTIICENSMISLDAGDYSYYNWSTGHTGRYLDVIAPGIYWVEILDGNQCLYRDTSVIRILPAPVSLLPGDTTICLPDSLVVNAGINDGYNDFLWNDLYDYPDRTLSDSGVYWVEISNPCGAVTDTVRLSKINCETVLWIPNAFSPNNDGMNGHFRVRGDNIEEFRMMIFDRWGTMIYETRDIMDGWDGKVDGRDMPGGVYVWLVSYVGNAYENPVREVKKGTFMLLK